MARPRVFISSTFYDLKHIRSSLETFVKSLGFDAVLSEKGGVPYAHDRPLDESCYKEAASADIFVLIVGGRYGSQASAEPEAAHQSRLDEYESVTKKEFEAAYDANIPIFVMIEAGVAAEYQTYSKNRNNGDIEYAHVDSPNVFKFIDLIYSKKQNNAAFNFSDANEIQNCLRDQWAAIFRDLLKSKSQQKQLTALTEQVGELKAVNSTLKNYLEEVIKGVRPENFEIFIKNETEKLITATMIEKLKSNPFFDFIITCNKNLDGEDFDLSDDKILEIASKPETADELIDLIKTIFPLNSTGSNRVIEVFEEFRGAQMDYNKARKIIDKKRIDFSRSSNPRISNTARPGSNGVIDMDASDLAM